MSVISIPCPACGQPLKIRDRNLLGRKGKCPKCQHSFVLEEPAEAALHLATSTAPAGATAWAPTAAPPPQAFAPAPATAPLVAPVATSGVGRLREIRKHNSKRRWISMIVGLVVVAAASGGGYFLYTEQQAAALKIKQAQEQAEAAADTGTSAPKAFVTGVATTGVSASPTAGKPISLELVPAGARTIVHLRPAELWKPGSPGEEFRYCLGPLGTFLEQQIQAICKRPAADIEELLFAWIPGQRGTPPDFAVVVHLKEDAKKSELLDMIGGQVDDTHGHPVYIDGDRAGIIANLKTYAIAPASMAVDLVTGIAGQNPQPTGIEALIAQTDRDRHLTIIFEPTAVLLDGEFMVPPAAYPFLKQTMDWFGDDAETVAWSAHLESDRFYSELAVRNLTTINTAALEERLQERLNALPTELLNAVRLMQPREQGKREIIGRVPAMMKVVAMATQSDHGPRHVRLVTPMPDRAAPNLALGSLLAWDESTRTDFNRKPAAAPPSAEPSNLPATLAERLKKKIDIDFRRTPLQEAFAFLGDETTVKFDIDGDALKLAGYTQNMPQSFKMDQVPATEGLAAILKQYDKMCVVLDEPQKVAIVMTYQVAEQRGLTPMALPIPK